MRRRRPATWATAWLSAWIGAWMALSACPTTPRVPDGERLSDAAYPGLLRAPSALAEDVLWQQRVTARWGAGGTSRGFDAALQKRGDTLTLVGLTPVGTRAFVVTQEGERLGIEGEHADTLPFPPRFIMLDIQRVFFPWLEGLPPAEGERVGVVDGERVVERYADGALRERCFERVDGPPEGRVCVTYEGWEPGQRAPRRAVLESGWYGYSLEVETHAETPL